MFTEDGELLLNAQMYLSIEESVERPKCLPSLIFQELFAKLTRFAGIASDMFVGKERFATILSRLVETVVLWLSEDQAFWEDIETGLTPLGPLGLQKVAFGMSLLGRH